VFVPPPNQGVLSSFTQSVDMLGSEIAVAPMECEASLNAVCFIFFRKLNSFLRLVNLTTAIVFI